VANDAYLTAVLTAVIRGLHGQRVDFALAGGLAYSALVTPRATVDIDVLILMPTRPPTDLFEGLRAALPVFRPHDQPMVFRRATIWRALGGEPGREIVLDFILAENDFHRSALARKRTVAFAGMALPIVAIEDLVLLKALAGRAQDRADIEGVLTGAGITLDREYLDQWARRLGVDLALPGRSESS
jgi:hypothetical protein